MGKKRVAILQSNYIPWKGYFDMIASVDEFIIYDDMQYTRRDWRNRNKIKTPNGVQWLTIPVDVKGKYHQKIRETTVKDPEWWKNHWKLLEQNYKRATYFEEISGWLKPLYVKAGSHQYLSEINRLFLEQICSYLEISTKITNSWDYSQTDGKTERLVTLCIQAGGDEYISGPAAKDYIEDTVFQKEGIALTWFDYSGYEPYPQMWNNFEHGVTILDLLFNCGSQSAQYMKHVKT
jgi:hypothetical protein